MNIFFTASIRGGRAEQPNYESIVKILETYGTVYSRHVKDDTLSEFGETALSASEISEREQVALEASDVVVADVTQPSLGVGYLIGQATGRGKRVIALYRGTDTLKLSAMIKGDPLVTVQTYETDEDIETVLDISLRG